MVTQNNINESNNSSSKTTTSSSSATSSSSTSSSSDLSSDSIDDKLHQDIPKFCWCPTDLNIPGENGSNIDLMSTFNIDNSKKISHISTPNDPSTFLPKSIYPPTFDGWKVLSDSVIKSAKHHTSLIKVSGTNKKMGHNKFKEYTYVIKCCRGLCRTHSKTTKKTVMNESDNYRKDQFVNKLSSTRGTFKHEGKGFVRRSYSHRSKSNNCPFQVTFKLKIGSYWRIVHTKNKNQFHNHIKLEKSELRIPSNRLSNSEKEIASCATKYGTATVASQITSELSDQSITYKQAITIHKFFDNDGTTKGSSDATKLMEYIRIKSKEKKLNTKQSTTKLLSLP